MDTYTKLHMVGCTTAQGVEWHLNHIHSTNYTEVINTCSAANGAEIDYI